MNNQIKISIPSPCHEKWQDMTPAEKGRFCGSCQTKVVDFTNMSDREIIAVASDDKYICGRFINSQLNRDVFIPKEKKLVWMAASAAVPTFMTLGSNKIIAQIPVPTEQQPLQIEKLTDNKAPQSPNVKTINGAVTDTAGLPMPGAVIRVRGKNTEAQADFDGNYSIEAEQGDILEFLFADFITETAIVGTSDTINITLVPEEYIEVTIGLYVIKKPTFFGRIFHKIGNLFRKNEK